MTRDQLRQMYQNQVLVEAQVEPSLHGQSGWIVACRDARGQLHRLTDYAGGECCYGSLDDAMESAQQIGFAQVRIID
ncbi:hypothetical protein VST7929_00256 [Vibrio stylophorae]|uniref:Thymidylate kinase n=1 Tax=Vibrio stylophorae TaxID=659351 RepID=A0ABM8ZQ54_9VIBR|nr:thymidylate kinase [Vibrio stylophorae]CAH0532427.1 hypothetical protein VST7929_00256 [Vibrio stylophorae]